MAGATELLTDALDEFEGRHAVVQVKGEVFGSDALDAAYAAGWQLVSVVLVPDGRIAYFFARLHTVH